MVQTDISTQVDQFFAQFKLKKYKKGETILDPDSSLLGVYYIKNGSVREYSISPEGVEVTLHIFAPFSYFPMTWIICDLPNRYFYEATTEVEIIIAPKRKILDFLTTHPKVLLHLTSRLLKGLDKMTMRVEYLITSNAHKKILSSLLFLARRFGEKKGTNVYIMNKFTHKDIAAFAGVTRETASRELEKLQKSGMIEIGNHLIIKTIEKIESELNA